MFAVKALPFSGEARPVVRMFISNATTIAPFGANDRDPVFQITTLFGVPIG